LFGMCRMYSTRSRYSILESAQKATSDYGIHFTFLLWSITTMSNCNIEIVNAETKPATNARFPITEPMFERSRARFESDYVYSYATRSRELCAVPLVLDFNSIRSFSGYSDSISLQKWLSDNQFGDSTTNEFQLETLKIVSDDNVPGSSISSTLELSPFKGTTIRSMSEEVLDMQFNAGGSVWATSFAPQKVPCTFEADKVDASSHYVDQYLAVGVSHMGLRMECAQLPTPVKKEHTESTGTVCFNVLDTDVQRQLRALETHHNLLQIWHFKGSCTPNSEAKGCAKMVRTAGSAVKKPVAIKDPNYVPKPKGRPRKTPIEDVKPKGPRGRPRKHPKVEGDEIKGYAGVVTGKGRSGDRGVTGSGVGSNCTGIVGVEALDCLFILNDDDVDDDSDDDDSMGVSTAKGNSRKNKTTIVASDSDSDIEEEHDMVAIMSGNSTSTLAAAATAKTSFTGKGSSAKQSASGKGTLAVKRRLSRTADTGDTDDLQIESVAEGEGEEEKEEEGGGKGRNSKNDDQAIRPSKEGDGGSEVTIEISYCVSFPFRGPTWGLSWCPVKHYGTEQEGRATHGECSKQWRSATCSTGAACASGRDGAMFIGILAALNGDGSCTVMRLPCHESRPQGPFSTSTTGPLSFRGKFHLLLFCCVLCSNV
jgi:hypothetical protein